MSNIIRFPGAFKLNIEDKPLCGETKSDKVQSDNRPGEQITQNELLKIYTSRTVLDKIKELNSLLARGNYSKSSFQLHWNTFSQLDDEEVVELLLNLNIEESKGRPAYLAALSQSISTRGQEIIGRAKGE